MLKVEVPKTVGRGQFCLHDGRRMIGPCCTVGAVVYALLRQEQALNQQTPEASLELGAIRKAVDMFCAAGMRPGDITNQNDGIDDPEERRLFCIDTLSKLPDVELVIL